MHSRRSVRTVAPSSNTSRNTRAFFTTKTVKVLQTPGDSVTWILGPRTLVQRYLITTSHLQKTRGDVGRQKRKIIYIKEKIYNDTKRHPKPKREMRVSKGDLKENTESLSSKNITSEKPLQSFSMGLCVCCAGISWAPQSVADMTDWTGGRRGGGGCRNI